MSETAWSLPFANGDSFRLCTEGLQALERFERRNSKADLELAERKLAECVRRYPSDVVPKFYLGSVKTLGGYEGLDEAVRILREVIESNNESLKEPAQYNLAVAYIEKYDPASLQQAEHLLTMLLHSGQKATSLEVRLKWFARADLLYIEGHRLWTRRDSHDPEVPPQIRSLRGKIAKFEEDLSRSTLKDDPEILAHYWNVVATADETEAHYVQGEPRITLIERAKSEYQKALQLKSGWIAAKSNLARLHYELLGDHAESRRLWDDVLNNRPGDRYAHYSLGLICRQEGKRDEARVHFREAAPDIREAETALKEMDAQDTEVTPEGVD